MLRPFRVLRRRASAPALLLLIALAGLAPAPSGAAAAPPRPIEASDPMAAVDSFLDTMRAAYDNLLADRDLAMEREIARAERLLDLSGIPPATRRSGGVEAALALKESLDRLPLPDAAPSGAPARYRIPGSEIDLVRVAEGPRVGDYLFSADTVLRAMEIFDGLRDQPYLDRSSVTPGFRDLHILNPGPWISNRWIATLPEWLRRPYQEQTVWQWLAMAAILAILGVAAALSFRIGARSDRARRERGSLHRYGAVVASLVCLAMTAGAHYLIDVQVNVTNSVLVAVSYGLTVAAYGFAVVLVWTLCGQIARGVGGAPTGRMARLDGSLTRLLLRLLAVVGIVYLLMDASERLGIPIAPLLAGVGIGGLALALAARSTVENLIAGLTLIADRPVRVGEFCRYGKWAGTIEEIGLRSIRLRTVDRTLLTVPNAQFAGAEIENFGRRDGHPLRWTLRLAKDTPVDRLRAALERLRAMAEADASIDPARSRIRLEGYEGYAYEIEFNLGVRLTDFSAFKAFREEFVLRALDLLQELGVALALPARDVHVVSDAAPSPAEADPGHLRRVGNWAAS